MSDKRIIGVGIVSEIINTAIFEISIYSGLDYYLTILKIFGEIINGFNIFR
jgi:hypothetical protein